METDFFISDRSLKFFKRPIPSSTLYPEKLGLNNFTSTYPLPLAFNDYNYIDLNITIHKDVCGFTDLEEESIKVYPKKVGFFYV